MAVVVESESYYSSPPASPVSVTAPTGITATDYVVAHVTFVDSSPTATIGAPSGFVSRGSQLDGDPGIGVTLHQLWFDSNGTDQSAASTFTFTSSVSPLNVIIHIARISGSIGWDSSAGAQQAMTVVGAGGSASMPSITTSVANALALGWVFSGGPNTPATWTLFSFYDVGNTSESLYKAMPVAGATGTDLVTSTNANVMSRNVIAYKPFVPPFVAPTILLVPSVAVNRSSRW